MKTTEKHLNSKTVTIFRSGSFLARAQGPAIQDYFESAKVSIGSYFESQSSTMIGSGLTFEEQRVLMPILVDAPFEDREFRKLVRDYFSNIDTKVPHGTGCILEIGLAKNNAEPVSLENMPISIVDFVRYRHAYHHPFMALSKEEADSNPTKQYYIFDKSQLQEKNKKNTQEADAAMALYLAVKKDESKVNMLLTLLGLDPRSFTSESDKTDKLKEIAVQTPEKFTEKHNSDDFDIRYWIESMKNVKILLLIGQKYINADTKKVIGNTLEETIYFFKDDANSDEVGILKAKMQEALRNPLEAQKRATAPKEGTGATK